MNVEDSNRSIEILRTIKLLGTQAKRFVALSDFQANQNAKRHLLFGVGRRLFLIQHSLKRIDGLQLIGRRNPLESGARRDLDVFLNSFYIHLRGILDNLAWSSAYVLNLLGEISEDNNADRRRVSLFGKDYLKAIHARFPNLHQLIESSRDWHRDFTDLRDPIAHRIPLYSIPSFLTKSDVAELESLKSQRWIALNNEDYELAAHLMKNGLKLGSFEPFFHSDETDQLYDIWDKLLSDSTHLLPILEAFANELRMSVTKG